MIFILDTNVLLRFLVGDNNQQLEQVKKWFSQAERGEISIVVKPLVIAEACFVLESFYNVPKEKIAEKMIVFLSQRWLKVDDRNELLNLWDNYMNGFHFVDSFLIAWKEKNQELDQKNQHQVMTFDKAIQSKAL